MGLFKIKSGLLFDDQFQNLDARWINSPSNKVAISGEKMRLEHSDSTDGTKVLFELPEEDTLLLQVKAQYVPTKAGDVGGLTIWNNSMNKLEFLESEDITRSDEYSIWQARKRENLWAFYAHRSNSWEMLDSAIFSSPLMAGVILKGKPHLDFVPLNIERVILCRGSMLTVGNVNSGYKVVLEDEGGKIVNSYVVPDRFAGVDIELPTIPFTGRLKIYSPPSVSFPEGQLVSEQLKAQTFYGGDTFLQGSDVSVMWKGTELDTSGPTHLGTMKNGEILTRMTAVNQSIEQIAENIELTIKQFYAEFGWEWVDVANDKSGAPDTWLDSINLGTLNPGEEVNFWVKVERNEKNWATKPSHFIFDITHK